MINVVMNKIAKIQSEDFTEQGYREVKELIEKLNVVWQKEEKYWF